MEHVSDLGHDQWKTDAADVDHCRNCNNLIFWTRRDPALPHKYEFPSVNGRKSKKNSIAFNALPNHGHKCSLCMSYNLVKRDPIAGYQHICNICTKAIDENCCSPPTLVVMHPPNNTKGQYFTNAHGLHVKEHKPQNRASTYRQIDNDTAQFVEDVASGNIKRDVAMEDVIVTKEQQQQEQETLTAVIARTERSDVFRRIEKLEADMKAIFDTFRSLASNRDG